MLAFFAVLTFAWGVGSVPTGRLLARIVKDQALLSGTANPGPLVWFTTGAYKLSALAFALEAGKIIGAMQLAWALTGSYTVLLLAGVVAVIGHGYSVFMGFVPCRSSAVYIGFVLGAHVGVGGVSGLVWALVFYFTATPYKAIKATAAQLLVVPFLLFWFSGPWAGVFGLVLLGYGAYHHRHAGIKLVQRNTKL